MRIREYFTSVKQQLEEYNDFLQSRLTEANGEVSNREQEIASLRREGTDQTARIDQLTRERDEIRTAAARLDNQLTQLRAKYDSADIIEFKFPKVDQAAQQSLSHQQKAFETLWLTDTMTSQPGISFRGTCRCRDRWRTTLR